MRGRGCMMIGGWMALATAAAADQAAPPQRVEFVTTDGVTLVADFTPAAGDGPAPLAILLHMYRQDRASWKPLIGPLHDAGFAIIALDLRGHGESLKPDDLRLAERARQRDPGFFNAMHLDVAAAAQWARRQPGVAPDKLVLVGASVGCSIAIDVAARDTTVAAVVCLSPGTNYLGVDSTEPITRTRNVPILLVAEEKERAAVDELAKRAANVKGDIVGPGDTHGTNMLGKIAGLEPKIVEFLKAALAGPKPE